MNNHLNEAIYGIEKVKALLFAIERTYIDVEVVPRDRELADKGIDAFYAVWDEVKLIEKELELLSGDSKVVDVLLAANELRKNAH